MTTTTNPLESVLAALEPRQVANDKIDRQQWLRARLGGITATEAKVLHKGSNRDKADVVKKKIEGDDFRGNKYTDWGNLREAALLEAAAATEYGFLVHAPGNPRHLATPDGLRKTWDGFAVVEAKTSKLDIAFGSPKFDDYGYLWQIVWQMYCADTDEAFYVWEQHDDDWSRWDERPRDRPEEWFEYGPTPIKLVVHHIVMTPELRAEAEKMIAAADRALTRLDKKVAEIRAERAGDAPEVSEEDADTERVIVAALETQARLYQSALDGEKKLGEQKKLATAGLLELSIKRWGDEVGEHEFIADPAEPSELFRIGYSPAGTKSGGTQVDVDAAKAADPKLWEELEALRIAFEAKRDQWQAHAANHTVTTVAATKAAARVTKKKGK